MWDYVIMLLFDENTSKKIEDLKDLLKSKNIFSTERPWPPHITVDLYKGISINALIDIINQFIGEIDAFYVDFKGLNKFDNRVLYLEPEINENFQVIKNHSDLMLSAYRIEENKKYEYTPHATLVINDDISGAMKILNSHFKPFRGSVKYLCVFNESMELQKQYSLK